MNALMILVAGPYRSGTNDDPVLIARNVEAMTDTALTLFRRGHLPVLGEWFALPLLERAGSRRIGDVIFDEIFHPVASPVSMTYRRWRDVVEPAPDPVRQRPDRRSVARSRFPR
jgi:hypothetical protein